MMTFLPFEDFNKCAEVLDKKRCWKQVVEASQIIDCLEGKKVGWKNHPAVKMWVGYENLLKHYYNIFLEHCVSVHNINTKFQYREGLYSYGFYGNLMITENANNSKPFWLGQEPFHRAMRARLIEKNPEFYGPKFLDKDKGYNDSKYWWPVMENKTFRII